MELAFIAIVAAVGLALFAAFRPAKPAAVLTRTGRGRR
jgi:hypothetical protein